MMLSLLPNVLDDTRDLKSRIVIWKGELVVLLLFAEQKINFEKIPKSILNEVEKKNHEFLKQIDSTRFSDPR